MKNSVSSDIRLYFEEIVNLQASGNDFPVILDDVWPLAYSRKDKAVQTLKSSNLFVQDIDFKALPPNGGVPKWGGFVDKRRILSIHSLP